MVIFVFEGTDGSPCGLGLAKGWSAEKLEVLVTRYVSKLLKAKLTTLARNVNDVA